MAASPKMHQSTAAAECQWHADTRGSMARPCVPRTSQGKLPSKHVGAQAHTHAGRCRRHGRQHAAGFRARAPVWHHDARGRHPPCVITLPTARVVRQQPMHVVGGHDMALTAQSGHHERIHVNAMLQETTKATAGTPTRRHDTAPPFTRCLRDKQSRGNAHVRSSRRQPAAAVMQKLDAALADTAHEHTSASDNTRTAPATHQPCAIKHHTHGHHTNTLPGQPPLPRGRSTARRWRAPCPPCALFP
jgi:hypothetical protein